MMGLFLRENQPRPKLRKKGNSHNEAQKAQKRTKTHFSIILSPYNAYSAYRDNKLRKFMPF